MEVICNNCKSKFNTQNINEDICPCCFSTSFVKAIDYKEAKQEAKSKSKSEETKNCIIYYMRYGQFKVMHKDSHFYTHLCGDISALLKPESNIRFYTESGAVNAVSKMKERDADWNLCIKKVF